MSKCKNCGVEILDQTERCPLCASAVEWDPNVENVYPDISMKTRKMLLSARIYLFAAIVISSVLIYINVIFPFAVAWSFIPVLILFYGYAILRYAILGKSGYMSKVIVLVLLVAVLNLIADFAYGYNGWSLNYVFPGLIVLMDIAIIVLMIVNHRLWQSYLMVQIFMVLVSAVVLILELTGVGSSLRPALGAFAASVFLFLGTMIIGGNKSRQELKRRFHVL